MHAVVAVMAKAPEVGAVKTRLCPPLAPADAAALGAAFLADTTARVRAVPGARGAFLFAPASAEAYFAGLAPDFLRVAQAGCDLGARLAHGFAALFAGGGGPVVVLGADVPTLPAGRLAEALDRLRDPGVDVVLGPSEDGGYHLLGLRRPAPALFAGVPWSTPGVLAATLANAAEAGLAVDRLPPWFDVDTPEDLARLARSLAREPAAAPRTHAVLARIGA